MAKQEVGRAAQGAGQVDLKQQDVAQLLKKKVQDQDSQQAAPAAQEIAAADSVISVDAASAVAASADNGLFGGASTGTIVAVGAAIVGGGFLIAEASDDDDEGGATSPPPPPGTGPGTGGDITLTADQETVGTDVTDDDFRISADGTDTVHGIVDPGEIFANDETTFSNGDVIKGNGKTIVQLDVDSGGFADIVEMSDIATVELIAQTAATVTFHAGEWDNVGEVAYVAGAGGMGVLVTSADVGLDMSIADNVAGGFIGGSYTNNLFAGVFNSGKGGGSIVHDAGNVADLTVNVANLNSGSMFFSGILPGDVTVGDMTGVAGDSAVLFAGNGAGVVGDVSVQNISLSLGDNGQASVSLSASGDLSFGDVDVVVGDFTSIPAVGTTTDIVNAFFSATGNLTGGDISVAIGDVVQTTSFTAISAGVFATGDINVGDINLSVGDVTHTSSGSWTVITLNVSGSGDVNVGNVSLAAGDYAIAGDPSVSGTGNLFFEVDHFTGATGHNIAVGDVSVVGGDNFYVSAWLHMGTSSSNSGTDLSVGDVTLGVGDLIPTTLLAAGPGAAGMGLFVTNTNAFAGADLTVGNITANGGISSTLAVTVSHSGIGGTTQTGDLGNLTVGNISVDLGRDATGTIDIHQQQSGSTSIQHGMGSLTVGDLDITLGQDATVSIDIDQSLTGTSAGAMGDFTVGNLVANLGIGASFTYALAASNNATSNTASGTLMNLGDISIGDVTIVGDDGASVSISYTFNATSGDIGSIAVGDMDITLGVGASFTLGFTATANNIGTVTIGDWSFNLDQSASGDFGNSIDISASSGDIGSVVVGDVSLVLADLAVWSDFAWNIFATGDIGAVTFGDFNVELGMSATWSSYAYHSISASGDVGDVTVGNIALDVGTGAGIANSVDYNIYGDDVGAVTFGDVALSGHGMASSLSVDLSVTAEADIESFTVGDVSLVADNSNTTSISFSVNLTAAGEIGDINVGNVLINYTTASTGGLTFTLNQAAATDGDITIGGLTLDFTAIGTTAAAATEYYTFGVYGDAGDIHINLLDVDIKINSTFDGTAAADLAEFTNLLNLSNILASVSNTGTATISLGTVDYSDVEYTGALVDPTLTIDLLTGNGGGSFTGDITVIGSSLNDLIIANTTGLMTFTGNDGADIFNFGTGNGATTQAGASKVTDFEHNVDLVQVTGDNLTADQYAEGTYASFAAFLADAAARFGDAVEDDMLAGQIGSSVFVIYDQDDSDTVNSADFVIELQNVSLSTLDFGDFTVI